MRKCIILYTGLLLSVSGCSLLELDESTGLNREEAYSYFSNVKGLATYVYSQLPGDLGVLDGALRESATDNSVYIWSDNSVHDFYNNAWSPNNAVDNMWSKCYGAIRSVNSFLENYSQERLERSVGMIRMKKILPKLLCIVKNCGCCGLSTCSNWPNDTEIFHY